MEIAGFWELGINIVRAMMLLILLPPKQKLTKFAFFLQFDNS